MSKKDINKVVGAAYEDLNAEDMQQTQGAGDVDAETTPALATTVVFASAAIISAKKC